MGDSNKSLKGFVQPTLAPSLLDDKKESDEETMNFPMTRKYDKDLNQKLNMLVRHGEAFSTSNFSNMMLVHEEIVKTLLSKSKRLLEENEKLVKEHATKMEVALNEMKELQTLILNDNTVHRSINTLVNHYDSKAKMADAIGRKEMMNGKLTQELSFVQSELTKKDDEILLVKACNMNS